MGSATKEKAKTQKKQPILNGELWNPGLYMFASLALHGISIPTSIFCTAERFPGVVMVDLLQFLETRQVWQDLEGCGYFSSECNLD